MDVFPDPPEDQKFTRMPSAKDLGFKEVTTPTKHQTKILEALKRRNGNATGPELKHDCIVRKDLSPVENTSRVSNATFYKELKGLIKEGDVKLQRERIKGRPKKAVIHYVLS